MIILEDLLYTEEHLWVKPDQDRKRAMIGVTDYGQEKIGMITSIDLPSVGDEFVVGDCFGTLENSIGEVTELITPVSGEVATVNEQLPETPGFINDDPYDDGWIMVIRLVHPEELDDLMDSQEYEEYVEEARIKDEEEEDLEDPEDLLEVEE